MSKSTDTVLLLPGETGWEIWTGQHPADFTLHSATEIPLASNLKDLPGGDLLLCFPVKAITAIPMRVNSEDDALFADLAALHAERLGLRPDAMAGQLTDLFVISREKENTALVSILLRSPGEGEMPTRGPKAFDISPRAFPLTGDSIAVWKEFGRWVFSISKAGNLVYCQATSSTFGHPDDGLAREIRIAMMQLSMQGLEVQPTKVVVWTNSPEVNPAALRSAFGTQVDVEPRPAPHIPDPVSKLLPADVRAARRAAAKRLNIIFAIAAVAIFYFGLLGWVGYSLWQDHQETKVLLAQAAEAAPDGEAYTLHLKKWDELAEGIELKHSPVDILNRIASCIPPGSGLRLRTADISANEIRLIGEAPQLQAVNSFSLSLSKNNDLLDFAWQTPEPNQSTRGWEFNFQADIPTPP